MIFSYHKVSRGKEAKTYIILVPGKEGKPFGFGTVQKQPNGTWRGCTMKDDCQKGFSMRAKAAKWAWEKHQETKNGN